VAGTWGHPGNDLQTVDYVNATQTYPFRRGVPASLHLRDRPRDRAVTRVLNPVWRGINGGALMTYGLSETGKP
jgi:hypothetical protein